jgi:DNA mismatch repair protein MutS2
MNLSDKTRADLGWDLLLGHLASRCGTERGAAAARALAPLPAIEDALARQAEVSEARALQDSGEPLTFGGIIDLTAVLERARKGGVLLGTELLDVSRALQAGARLRRHLAARAERTPRLLGRAALLAELSNVSAPIANAFDDAGGLRDSASPALRGLRQRAQALQAELGERTDRLLNEGHIAPYLQDRFVTQREERYVVPVRADARARVRGIVHGTSASGATVFVEPEEIIDLNNRLKLAQLEVADEERRILAELSALVAEAAVRIAQNLEILSHLDLVNGAARLSSDLRAGPLPLHPPGQGGIDLRNARHPLLHLGGVAVVPSDITVPAGGALVVSGPNAGGKTVALKAAGLCALMARAGLHAPVQEGSSMPAFTAVLTDVGDDQSLERSLSTFSAHMLNLCAYLAKAETEKQGLLILLDEVAAGTDPEQGAALAQAILEHFARCGATVIVTTHYDRLKALAAQDRRFVNASVGYDLDRLQPTYRLHLGVPGASGAVLVARRLGLPVEVAARAEVLLGDRRAGIEELLQNLSRERERLLGERQAAEEARRRAEADERAAHALHAEAQAELRRARRQAHDEAVTSLRRARQELEDLSRSARKAAQQAEAGEKEATATVQAHKGRIEKLAKEVAAAAPAPEVPPGRAAGPADVVPGARVVVPRLGGIGTVVSDVMKDKVVVQVGALKLSVDVAELLVPQGEGRQQRQRQAPGQGQAQVPVPVQVQAGPGQGPAGGGGGGGGRIRTPASTLDVRGERVDAALSRAEKFLDDAMRAGESAIFIIHGHGTGALRAAIRAHFQGYPGVSSLYAAGQADGGDGVTVLELGA